MDSTEKPRRICSTRLDTAERVITHLKGSPCITKIPFNGLVLEWLDKLDCALKEAALRVFKTVMDVTKDPEMNEDTIRIDSGNEAGPIVISGVTPFAVDEASAVH